MDPSYSVFFSKDTYLQVPADKKKLVSMFESIETGAGERLIRFLQEAERKYTIAMKDFIYTPSLSFLEFFRLDILKQFFTLDIFSSMKNHIHKHFSHPHLRTLMEFPILFLGATSTNTPALYSIMNYADMELGTWYPEKGMYSVVEAMELLAREKGVTILTNTEVQKIIVQNRKAYALLTPKENFYPDVVISSADYQHTDNHLLDYPYQNYSHSYWEKKIFAPSALLFYVGINKKLTSITHHTLFFDASLEEHSQSIYTHKQYPQNPLFYLSATSQTDETTAPHGCENLVFLIPLAVDLEDTEEMREKYFQIIVKRFETLTGESIQHNIIYKKSYSLQNFKQDYHAFKGNAYGLANTLWQTALWKPKIINKHISNLYYTGQLTVPGPGSPSLPYFRGNCCKIYSQKT